jgi:predicted methyltransferase
MPLPRQISRLWCYMLIVFVLFVVACDQGSTAPEPIDLSVAIQQAVDNPQRTEADRARDADRHPAAVLEFFGLEPGMNVVDVMAGTGYYSEMMASVVGPEGMVIIQNAKFPVESVYGEALDQRMTHLQESGVENVQRIDAELDEMELPSNLDGAIFIRFYHDLFWIPVREDEKTDRQEFLRRVYQSLKPGAFFGVIDHHAEAGSGERDALDRRKGLHRIDIELVKREILEAGFVLDAESDLLQNPDDTRDWNIFSEGRRDKTDRFVLRFLKPAAE